MSAEVPARDGEGGGQSPTFAAAIRYVEHHKFSVIPLRPGSKRPALESWKEYQERRPRLDELERWFAGSRNNIAIVTGTISGILVVDVDGPEGEQSISGLEIPRTPQVRTPHGRHIYFAHPGGHVPNRGHVAPGIDIRADGGFVVAPPSRVVGDDGPVEYGSVPSLGLDLPFGPVTGVPIAWLNGSQVQLERDLPEVIHDGQERWRHLTSLAGTLRRRGLDERALVEQLRVFNRSHCRPPKPDADVRRIAHWVVVHDTTAGLREDPEVERPKVVRERPGLGALSREAALERIASRPVTMLIRDVLVSVDYGTLAGSKGVGKSLALDDMAVSVGLAEPWLGHFPTTEGIVLVLSCEDHEAVVWSRLDAIAIAKGRKPEDLEGRVFVHPFPFSAVQDVGRFEAEIETVGPALVILEPAYKYLGGVNARMLFDMGAVLTPLQAACWRHHAAFMVGHHYNRREGAEREDRIQGAGILEWARVVITLEADAQRAGDADDVELLVEISGNALPPVALRGRRTVWAMTDDPIPELGYRFDVVAEGGAARHKPRPASAADHIRGVLGHEMGDGLTVAEIQDKVGPVVRGDDGQDHHLKRSTIRAALNRGLEGEVDNDGEPGAATRWWRV